MSKVASMLLRTTLMLVVLQGSLRADDIVIERAVLSLIDHADVPAEQAGRLERVLVREGEAVKQGQPLVQLDDREARLARQRAELELASARYLSGDLSRVNSAKKAAERQRQIAIEQQIEFDVAQSEALNDVAVRAAGKSKDVAENEYNRGLRSREASKNSVSESTLDGLKLELEKATLTHEQAEFQLSVLKLKLDARRAAVRTQGLAVESAELAVKEAESLQQVAALQADLKRHDVEAAAVNIAQRIVSSPIDGVVVELPRQAGEWVQPGEKVARIIGLGRLRAEGFLPLAKSNAALVGRPVMVEVVTTDRGTLARPGKITFVSPDVDPINQEVRFWAEIDNPEAALLPGLRATIRIPLAAGTTAAANS